MASSTKSSFFKIKEPDPPPGNSYTEIVDYLIDSNKAAINYYRLVSLCGVLGFAVALILICISDSHKSAFLKECPAAIYSGITLAFGQLEIEKKKKELYEKLKEIVKNQDFEDRYKIIADYKSWSWEEFRNTFKS